MNLYFAKAADSTFDYFALLGSVVIGSGRLIYSPPAGALLSHTVTRPARLPGPAGFDPPVISLDLGTPTSEGGTGLDGMTSTAGYSDIQLEAQDGVGASFGPDCPPAPADAGPSGPEARRAEPIVGMPACATGETRSFFIAVNLPTSLPVAAGRWNADAPLPLTLTDARGRSALLSMYFRHASPATWQYEVVPPHQTDSEPLGSGVLTFNDNGSLRRVDVSKRISYALPELGSVLDIALVFGPGTDAGGAGLDGSTAFPSAPAVVNLSVRGSGPGLGAPCSESTVLSDATPLPNAVLDAKRSPYSTTRTVFYTDINLSPLEPLRREAWDPGAAAATSSVAFAAQIFDASGNIWRLTFYGRHVAAADWEYAFIADSELGSVIGDLVSLHFAESGALQRGSLTSTLRLPLSDGSPGPTIELLGGTAIDQGGNGTDGVVSFSAPSTGDLEVSASQVDPR